MLGRRRAVKLSDAMDCLNSSRVILLSFWEAFESASLLKLLLCHALEHPRNSLLWSTLVNVEGDIQSTDTQIPLKPVLSELLLSAKIF